MWPLVIAGGLLVATWEQGCSIIYFIGLRRVIHTYISSLKNEDYSFLRSPQAGVYDYLNIAQPPELTADIISFRCPKMNLTGMTKFLK